MGMRVTMIAIFAAAILAGLAALAMYTDGWLSLVETVHMHQQAFSDEITRSLQAIRQDGWTASGTLVGLSFLYGLLHAAGPGHGKVIISTYLLTHPSAVRRGILLSVAAAMLQGLVAILLVLAIVVIARRALEETTLAQSVSELISILLIIGVGGWLMIRSGRPLWHSLFGRATDVSPTGCHHHKDDHHHDGASCGHVHGPNPEQVNSATSLRTALAVIFSVGLRPCSGALIVLSLAVALDFLTAGIAAVIAMSTGTAIAISLLAIIAVTSRDMAVKFVGQETKSVSLIGNGLGFFGGLILSLLGLVLVLGMASQETPFGLKGGTL